MDNASRFPRPLMSADNETPSPMDTLSRRVAELRRALNGDGEPDRFAVSARRWLHPDETRR
ncbi:MAG TPA: hypothetical protein VGM37_14790 [Armatimonadota bacterium]